MKYQSYKEYEADIIDGNFKNEFEYWDKMAHFSIAGDKVYYNFQKVRNIIKILCDYDLMLPQVLEVGAAMAFVAGALGTGGLMKHYKCTECGDTYIKFLDDRWGIKADKAKMVALPYEDKSFDVVFLFDVLEHIAPGEREASYRELSRVMKDDRQIFINNPSMKNHSYHNPHYDHNFGFQEVLDFNKIMGTSIRRVEYYCCEGYGEIKVPNYYHFIEVSNK